MVRKLQVIAMFIFVVFLVLKIAFLKNYLKLCGVRGMDKYIWYMTKALGNRQVGAPVTHTGPCRAPRGFSEEQWKAGSSSQVRTWSLPLSLQLSSGFSKCGPWTKSISITWELQNARSQVPPRLIESDTLRTNPANWVYRLHEDSHAYQSLELIFLMLEISGPWVSITGNYAHWHWFGLQALKPEDLGSQDQPMGKLLVLPQTL